MTNYQNYPIRFGLQGLVLKRARDVVSPTEATILSNFDSVNGGKFVVRGGQTLFFAQGANVHTIRRLNALNGASYARLYGIDGSIYLGTGGAPSLADTGYSGNYLTTVPYRSELAGDTWLYVADSNQMRKIRIDGLAMPIGLAAPATAAIGASVDSPLTVTIDAMNSATGWAGHHDSSSGAPTVNTSAPSPPSGGSATTLITNAGTAKVAYTTWMDKALAVNLTTFGGGVTLTDADYMHLWVYVDFPANITEVRVYLVTGTFTAGVVPGTSATQNLNGYWASFGSDAFTAAIAGAPTIQGTITQAEQNAVNAASGRRSPTEGNAIGTAVPIPGTNIAPSAAAWVEYAGTPQIVTQPPPDPGANYSTTSKPLYRSDFSAFGSAPDWSNVTGIVVWVSVKANSVSGSVSPNVTVAVHDFHAMGGYGLDDGVTGGSQYDWLFTNYDPRTGAESNSNGGLPIATQGPAKDVLRGSVTLTPTAYGDGNIRQRFYRRGGVVTDNWYFTGVNTSDGGTFKDTNTDAFTTGTGLTVPVDHFQPVATVDSSGNTVLNQPVNVIFGPVQGMLLACGDPYRPGWLYCCKPNEPDHWVNAIEVCGSSTPLLAGCVDNDHAFVFSSEAGFSIVPNLDAGGGITSIPTDCHHGPVGTWALTNGLGGIYIGTRDGIFVTSGNDEGFPISDDIAPLFQGLTVNGQAPIDFSHPERVKLQIIGTDLWFIFLGTDGFQAHYLYSLIYKTWRRYDFAHPILVAYLEEGVPKSILLGEQASGIVDVFGGLTDRGTPIVGHYRSGALDQGMPRSPKRYGNWALDVDNGAQLGGAASQFTAQAYLDDETRPEGAFNVPGFSGRIRYTVDPFSAFTTRGRNISMDLIVSSVYTPPVLYLAEIAAALEPAEYVLWETDEIDHGLPGWQTPLFMWVSVRGSSYGVGEITGSIFCQRTVYDDLMNVILQDSYTITTTVNKSHQYVPFAPVKGALFMYRFASIQGAFLLYPEETSLTVQPQSGDAVTVRPFSSMEGAGSTVNPLLAAERAGGNA